MAYNLQQGCWHEILRGQGVCLNQRSVLEKEAGKCEMQTLYGLFCGHACWCWWWGDAICQVLHNESWWLLSALHCPRTGTRQPSSALPTGIQGTTVWMKSLSSRPYSYAIKALACKKSVRILHMGQCRQDGGLRGRKGEVEGKLWVSEQPEQE